MPKHHAVQRHLRPRTRLLTRHELVGSKGWGPPLVG